jgi:virginiamycin B lyase
MRKLLLISIMPLLPVGAAVWDVAYAFGSVWATNNADGSVSRIDPATNRIVKTIKTGAQPTNLGVGKDGIWVGSNGIDEQGIYRIVPATNAPATVPTGHDRPSGIVVTATAVWIANGDDTVTRLDPVTKEIVATVKVGKRPQQGAEAPDGTIWIPNQTANTISVIDPATNAVTRTVKTGKGRSSSAPASATCGSGASAASTCGDSGLDVWPGPSHTTGHGRVPCRAYNDEGPAARAPQVVWSLAGIS